MPTFRVTIVRRSGDSDRQPPRDDVVVVAANQTAARLLARQMPGVDCALAAVQIRTGPCTAPARAHAGARP